MELVERVEEFLLHAFLVAEKLNVVDQQHVGVPVLVVEPSHVVVVDAGEEVVAEFFTGDVNDLVFRVIFVHLVGNGVHQVGLSQTGGTVDEQGVVVLARFFCHGGAGRVGELIGAADNECGEGVLIVGTLKAVLQFLVAACQFIVIFGVAVFGKRVVIFFRCDDIDLDLDIQSQHVEKCLFQQGIVGVHNNGFLELGLYGEHCHRAVQLYRLHNIDPELHGSL